jgi:[acyl-carrier-protein] S-malonyltransferase
MAPARADLDVALRSASYASPAVPVLSGVTAREYDDVATTLSGQLTSPVRWRATCEALPSYGVDVVVEVGPGGVLTGLVKRSAPGLTATSAATPDDVAALR